MTKLMTSQAHSGFRLHFVALILASAACLPAFGVDYGPQDYSIVPPAPQVEALMDFKEYPVNYFSGSPQIDFNIYTLKVGQISVPITLSYHCGGIRVDQKAGNAGLGWNVSCGATNVQPGDIVTYEVSPTQEERTELGIQRELTFAHTAVIESVDNGHITEISNMRNNTAITSQSHKTTVEDYKNRDILLIKYYRKVIPDCTQFYTPETSDK